MTQRAIEPGILLLPEGEDAEPRLAGCRCQACGTVFHPARPVCLACHGHDLRPVEVSGRGTLHACTRVSMPLRPGRREGREYWVGQIALDDGPRVQGLLAAAFADPRIGARVCLGLETLRVSDDGEETVVHHFRPEEAAS